MKRSRPRPFSKRRESEREERKALVNRVLARDLHHCQATGWPHDCSGPLDVHERIPRARWAAGYLVDDNCLTVCRRAHDWIHAYPEQSTALGLLASA